MARVLALALTAVVFGGAASAQQIGMPGAPMTPQMVVVAQPPPIQQRSLGGGFIEYLFGDGPPQQQRYAAPPQYVAPPQYAPPQYQQPYPQQQTYIAPPGYPDGGQGGRPLYVNTAPQVDPMLEPQRPGHQLDPAVGRQELILPAPEQPGAGRGGKPKQFLFLVLPGNRALRYGIGVGRPGFTWSGVHTVSAKKEWPDWVPPKEMLERQPYLPHFMPGGPNNPLGARAMYLGSTLYRIHGSNEPWTIGQNVSSGCIRMRNDDVMDLYSRVKVGTKVVVM